MAPVLNRNNDYSHLFAREITASSSSDTHSHSPLPLILGVIGIFFVLVFFVLLAERTCEGFWKRYGRLRRDRGLRGWNRTREQQFRDAYGNLNVEAIRRDAVERMRRGRPWIGMATDRIYDGVMQGQVLTGDGSENRGRLERNRRERGRTGVNLTRTGTRMSLPRYTERDDGTLRVPEYDRMSLPEYGSGDLERAAWLEEGRNDGQFGEVEVELQVLERAVLE